jgi:tetratricopeptide (TPR) repeat protein
MATICPTPEVLARIGTGTGSCPTGLAAHIDQCPECQEFLDRRVHDGLETPTSRSAEVLTPDAVAQIDGFTVERELGRGAMGVVYLARRDGLSRKVALKSLPGGRRAGPRERRQWLREAEAASRVRHPNVVTLYEVGEADDCFLLVLEYIPGGTLADRLSGPLATTVAARLMETIARAVHHIHQHGQLHLDLKPSNILLDGDAGARWEAIVPKVSDFGIARTAEPGATDTGGVGAGGSPPYMAPEQIVRPRKDLTPSADIHALGAILYHLLAGMPPYRGATVLDTLEQVRNQEPVPPRRLIPQIPRDLETIVLKCLEKNPAGRYASAEAMADDLRCWLDGRTISARPASRFENLWRWCRRRPVVAALTAALTLTLAIAFVVVVLLWRHAEGERRRAENELRFSGEVLSEIAGAGSSGSAEAFVLTRDNVIAIFQRTRNHILELRTQRPNDLNTCHQLAQLDLALATQLLDRGKLQESRPLIDECLENLDRVLQRHPRELSALYDQFMAYRQLGMLADREGNGAESLRYLQQAVVHGEGYNRLKPGSAVIALAECRWLLARSLRCLGDVERAKALILANLGMLDDVPKLHGIPIIAIWRTLTRLDLLEFHAGASSAPASCPDGADPLLRLASSEADVLGAERWAELVARSLTSSPAPFDLSSNYAYDFVELLGRRVACQRRIGRIDEARRSTERMYAFARLLVTRFPGGTGAHLALSESYKQMAKNAWRTDDRVAVGRNWKLAIDAARRALALDPLNTRAGSESTDLQERLDRFLASKP